MKRKIFSILFALVLVVSFSLVTAVPAAADPSPSEYQTALEKSADYLVSTQDATGFWAKKPGGSWDADAENPTGNAITALLEAYSALGKEAYKTAAIGAGDYLISVFIAGDGSFDVHQAEVIGGNAYMNHLSPFLTAWIMLYQQTGETKYLDAATAFGDYLLTDGARCTDTDDPLYGLFGYLIRPGSPGLTCFSTPASLYHGHYLNYGYEQIYGLALLSEITGNAAYLEGAEAGAAVELSYQKVDGSFPDEMGGIGTLNIHYGSVKVLAYLKLYEITTDATYETAVVAYINWLLTQQNPDNSFGNPDYVRSTTWAAKALLGAYKLTGNGDYLAAANKAVSWLLAPGHGYDSSTGAVARYDEYTDVYIAYSQTPFVLTMAEAEADIPTEVWVATTGDDTNPGTELEPFATIQRGIDAVAEDGTVTVAAGTYTEELVFDGDEAANITIQGATGVADDVVLEGLVWFGGSTTGLTFDTIKFLAVHTNELFDTNGMRYSGDEWRVSALTVKNCHIVRDTATAVFRDMDNVIGDNFNFINNIVEGFSDIWFGVLYFEVLGGPVTTGWKINDNKFNNCGGTAIFALDQNGIEVKNNTIDYSAVAMNTLTWGAIQVAAGRDIANPNPILIEGNTVIGPGKTIHTGGNTENEFAGISVCCWENEADANATIKGNTITDCWRGISVANVSGVTIEDNDVSSCTAGLSPEGVCNDIVNSRNDIRDNNVGILFPDGGTSMYGTAYSNPDRDNVFHHDNIVGNTDYGIQNLTGIVVDATNNWWGDVSGPTHTSNALATGDEVTDNVDFSPWLGDPLGTTPMTFVYLVTGYDPLPVIDIATVDISGGNAPQGTIAFTSGHPDPAPPPLFVGTGKTGVVFLDVQVTGYTSGMAHITVPYDEGALEGVVEDTLGLYYWDGATFMWRIAGNSTVDTGNNIVSGYIPVSALTGTPIGLGGYPANEAQVEITASVSVDYSGNNVATIKVGTQTAQLGAVTIDLTFNPDVVQVLGGESSDFDSLTVNPALTLGKARFVANQLGATGVNAKDGAVLAQVRLKAVGTTGSSSPLTLSVVTLKDNDGIAIPIGAVTDGTATIGGLGDANSDGAVDVYDCVFIARAIAGIPGYTVTIAVGDVSGDGTVDAWDCTYLARHLAGIAGFERLGG